MTTTSSSDSQAGVEPEFSKGPDVQQTDLQPLSPALRDIRNQIQAGEAEDALSQVEALLLEQPMTVAQQGKVLALAADSEFQRGAYEEAAEIQEHAASLVEDDPLLWLRPRMGKIRALLKAAQIEAAWEQARVILTDARQKWSDFHSGARQIRHELRKGKVVQFSPRPERLSVIASELGRLFLREGEIAAAKEFLEAALDACPKGATRAREALAATPDSMLWCRVPSEHTDLSSPTEPPIVWRSLP